MERFVIHGSLEVLQEIHGIDHLVLGVWRLEVALVDLLEEARNEALQEAGHALRNTRAIRAYRRLDNFIGIFSRKQ